MGIEVGVEIIMLHTHTILKHTYTLIPLFIAIQ